MKIPTLPTKEENIYENIRIRWRHKPDLFTFNMHEWNLWISQILK